MGYSIYDSYGFLDDLTNYQLHYFSEWALSLGGPAEHLARHGTYEPPDGALADLRYSELYEQIRDLTGPDEPTEIVRKVFVGCLERGYDVLIISDDLGNEEVPDLKRPRKRARATRAVTLGGARAAKRKTTTPAR